MEINELIENKINNLDITENYAAILGQSPSKGAKSPKLWNAAFSGLNFSAFMYPFDVLPKNLCALIDSLRKDKKFIGGSIAAPYKTDVIKYIDYVEENVKAIGAVNCIYRDKNGKLVGTNTDGAGALWSLQSAYGNIAGVKVLNLFFYVFVLQVLVPFPFAFSFSSLLFFSSCCHDHPPRPFYVSRFVSLLCRTVSLFLSLL